MASAAREGLNWFSKVNPREPGNVWQIGWAMRCVHQQINDFINQKRFALTIALRARRARPPEVPEKAPLL